MPALNCILKVWGEVIKDEGHKLYVALVKYGFGCYEKSERSL